MAPLLVPAAVHAEPKRLAGVAYEETVRGEPAPGQVLPLLIAFHYSGGSAAESFENYDGLAGPVRILVPLGTFPKRKGFSYFPVDYYERGAADRQRIARATIGRMAAFIRAATALYGSRPVVTGISQGGDISFLLAIDHPDLIVASFPFAPVIPDEPPPAARSADTRPPIHVMQGETDPIVDVALTRRRVEALADRLPIRLTTYAGLGHDISPAMKRDYSRLIDAALRR